MSTYTDIISNRKKGPLAGLARGGLRVLAGAYGSVLAIRNWYYDYLANPVWLDRPCISIGNITAGGTGKTPVVMWLANELIRRGHKVAIISRGYKGDGQGNDELKLASETCPQAVCITNPDRVKAGRFAIEEYNVDVILLDDAFQHRRLGRDLNVVLIDATCPLGHEYVLPRGLLREPQGRLARADIIIITRVSLTTPGELKLLKEKCSRLAPDAKIIGCDHRPTRLVSLDGLYEELSVFSGRSIVAFAGIGNPEGFEQTIIQVGAKPLQMVSFADHHQYTSSDCRRICDAALRAGAEMLLTTEKDLVKLRRPAFDWPLPLRALQIVIDFVGDGGKMLLDQVNELLIEQEGTDDSPPPPTD